MGKCFMGAMFHGHMFHGQMCGARFSDDGAIYRAKITTVKVDMADVIYIDHGNSEWRNMGDLYKLPDQFLTPCPYVVTLDIDSCREQVLSESGLVVKLANVQGELIAIKSVEDNGPNMCEEVEVIKQMIHLEQEKLPIGQKVLVSVGCVESVDKVWVTPLKNVTGMKMHDGIVTIMMRVMLKMKLTKHPLWYGSGNMNAMKLYEVLGNIRYIVWYRRMFARPGQLQREILPSYLDKIASPYDEICEVVKIIEEIEVREDTEFRPWHILYIMTIFLAVCRDSFGRGIAEALSIKFP